MEIALIVILSVGGVVIAGLSIAILCTLHTHWRSVRVVRSIREKDAGECYCLFLRIDKDNAYVTLKKVLPSEWQPPHVEIAEDCRIRREDDLGTQEEKQGSNGESREI